MTKIISEEAPEPGNLYDAWWSCMQTIEKVRKWVGGYQGDEDASSMHLRLKRIDEVVKDYGEKEMTRIEKNKCDNCGNETHDFYNIVGWVQLELEQLHISDGRRPDGPAAPPLVFEKGKLDFCNVGCMMEWVNQKIKAGRAKKGESCADG